MPNKQLLSQEEKPDPQNWSTLKELVHRMEDDLLHHLENSSQQPAPGNQQAITKPANTVLRTENLEP